MLKRILIGTAALAMFCSEAMADVKITNGSKYTFTAVYFAPTSMKDWGKNHLGEQELNPGDSLNLTGVAAGTWDAQIVFEKGDDEYVCEINGVELSEAGDHSKFDTKTLDGCAKATEVAHKDDEGGDEEE